MLILRNVAFQTSVVTKSPSLGSISPWRTTGEVFEVPRRRETGNWQHRIVDNEGIAEGIGGVERGWHASRRT